MKPERKSVTQLQPLSYNDILKSLKLNTDFMKQELQPESSMGHDSRTTATSSVKGRKHDKRGKPLYKKPLSVGPKFSERTENEKEQIMEIYPKTRHILARARSESQLAEDTYAKRFGAT